MNSSSARGLKPLGQPTVMSELASLTSAIWEWMTISCSLVQTIAEAKVLPASLSSRCDCPASVIGSKCRVWSLVSDNRHLAEQVHVLQRLARAAHDAGQGVLGQGDREARLFLD